MEHFHQTSAILCLIDFAEYHLAFLKSDSLMVTYVTYNTVFLVLWEVLTLCFTYSNSARHLWPSALILLHAFLW